MTVYVDDMYLYPIGQFGRMKMSHLIATTTEELVAMARTIGVNPKWIQHAGTPGEHFDIAIVKRELAIAAGAVQITMRQAAAMCKRRRVTGELGEPADASDWLQNWAAARRSRHAEQNAQATALFDNPIGTA
ncbi:DUF4031 domain-containing protein [Paraburkholderia phenoliruptrix]|uniref:DUF4031 domain-containing protein n=1 Tax=Paraburkholderia phenoliruptrix TaxID=252970 RepID=UPI0034CD88ED